MVGRFSGSLSFSTRVQNLVPLLIQEPTEVASVTLVVLGLSLFRLVSDMGNESPLISVFRNLGLACRMTLFLPGDPYILWMLPYKYRRRQNLGSIDPIVLNNKQNITR